MPEYADPRRGPDPRSVPGYAEALAAGLLPSVPAVPPAPLGPSSSQFLLRSLGIAIAGLVAILLLNRQDPPGWVMGLLATALAVVVVSVVIKARRVTRAEILAGYARFDEFVALPGKDPEGRFAQSTGLRGAQWNLRGLWRIADDGSVVSPPDPTVLPPGHYPSPNRPGHLELWTGATWAYEYRPSPVQLPPA